MAVSQIGPATTAVPTAQLNFGQMWRELQMWNADLDPNVAKRMVQNAYRKVLDSRLWYGLMVHGQITVPEIYNTGTVAVTNGSATLTGTGTTFTSAMVGRQLRIGGNNPIHTIVTYTSPTSVDLDISWGGATATGLGYSIFQNIVNFGNRIKYLLAVVNKQQSYRMRLNVSQDELNARDPWRSGVGWTHTVAFYPPSSTGVPQFELYPIPTTQQAYPYIAYVQPDDFDADSDTPVPMVRSDVVVNLAVSESLLIGGKNSRFYDPNTAAIKKREHREELERMAKNDDNVAMRDLMLSFSSLPPGGGPMWSQSHDVDDGW